MRLKIKNRSQKYNINRPRSRYEHNYTKYKMYLSIMMITCIKQHLSNIWSSILEKVKQHWGWVEKKSVAYKKSVYCATWCSWWLLANLHYIPHLQQASYQTFRCTLLKFVILILTFTTEESGQEERYFSKKKFLLFRYYYYHYYYYYYLLYLFS